MLLRRWSSVAFAAAACVAAGGSHAGQKLKIVASSSIAPYVIAQADRGLVVDILRRSLAADGYTVSMEYAPNRRAKQEFVAGHTDGIYNIPCGTDHADFFYSAPIIDYQNVVVTADPPRARINTLGDLAHVTLVAFQSAPEFLGPEIGAIARANPAYQEVADQASQVDMLLSGHADAIVLDQRIFTYFYQHPRPGAPKRAGYRIVPMFPPMPRCAAFVDAAVRAAFN